MFQSGIIWCLRDLLLAMIIMTVWSLACVWIVSAIDYAMSQRSAIVDCNNTIVIIILVLGLVRV